MNITNKAILIINKIELGIEFLKSEICNEIGCRDKSLTYCFSELVKRGYLTIKKRGQLFIYRRVKVIAEFIRVRNKKKPMKAKINIVKDHYYYFAFGGRRV